jgi:glycosyltransferase involved in cell wall biosynthesis
MKSAYELAWEGSALARKGERNEPAEEPASRFVDDLPRNLCGSRKEMDEAIKEKKLDELKQKQARLAERAMLDMANHPKPRPPARSKLEVTYAGPFLSNSGFSRMNREIAFRLRTRGVRVKVETTGEQEQVSASDAKMIGAMTRETTSGKEPKIFGMTIPSLMAHGGRKILYTMVESSNAVHPEYAERVNLGSEAWVPSQYLKDIMERSGVNVPISVMPLGVDQNTFRADTTPMQLPPYVKSFRFLSVFWWGLRKGYDILLKAYLREFSADDDVSLIISSKLNKGRAPEPDDIVEKIRLYVRASKNPNPPHVMLQNEMLTDGQLASLYTACSAFVLMSRGEGFGLPILEAAACGLPVITTNCTAQSSYLSADEAFLIDPEGYETSVATGGSASDMAKSCRWYENQQFPIFRDKTITELGRVMRSIYEGKSQATAKAAKLRRKVVETMTWDDTVDRILERLSELAEKEERK